MKPLPEKAPRRYLYLDRPRCLDCGSCRLRLTRSAPVDEVQKRWVTCQQCGAKYFLIVE